MESQEKLDPLLLIPGPLHRSSVNSVVLLVLGERQMDERCLDYLLTEEEEIRFKRDGYFTLDDVLPDDLIDELNPIVDRTDAEYRKEIDAEPHARTNLLDFIGRDKAYVQLIDWYKTFPKVWSLMGWNIQLYHTHQIVTPGEPEGKTFEKDGPGVGFHQDSGRLNIDIETEPRPMISLKVAYVLSDSSEPGRGNFTCIPGSQLWGKFPGEDRKTLPEAGVQVCAKKGSAIFFDRRIWHSGSANYFSDPRRVLFYGYSNRWLRPRDNMTVDQYLADCDPIQQQLLGVSPNGGFGYTSPKPEDVPLKAWIEEHLGEEAITA